MEIVQLTLRNQTCRLHQLRTRSDIQLIRTRLGSTNTCSFPQPFSFIYITIKRRQFLLLTRSNLAIPYIGAVTRIEELTRIQATRRAHKGHVTRLVKKTSEVLTNEKPDEMLLSSLNTFLEQLVRKRDLIWELDQKIEAKSTDTKGLETEIFEAEELSCDLEEKINHIRKYIDLSISALNNPSTVFTQENTGSSLPSVSQNTCTEPSSAAADRCTVSDTRSINPRPSPHYKLTH
ncbi:Hypothetical predicted protein [Paramuricea clavata]|uniref:Uncharacterized protein n=1 Tax=Paramuricea clavata TaxID=317549 RepID=A0A7D9KY47_PARCT|nr:Hypothetical predicted protein [Paramuricea clavata]